MKHEMSWISQKQPDDAAEQQDETSNVDRVKLDEERRRMGHSDADFISAARRTTNMKQSREYYGLYNQGATCYLNSVLQVLFMTPEIHDRLGKELRTDVELKNIFERLKTNICGTETITTTFGITDVYQQCDAAECLEWILGNVNQEASEVFKGELTYKTTCKPAQHLIRNEEMSFLTLPLPLTNTQDSIYTLKEGFDSIFETKSFRGDNMVYCNECQEKTEGIRRCEDMKVPQILILLLKRFVLDYSTMSHVKTDFRVDVPPTFELMDRRYELYAMVNHRGSLRFGHYTATILSTEDKTWYEFNDAYVRKADAQPFAENEPYISRAAYLLMYRASPPQMTPQAKSEDLLDEAKNQQDETKEELKEEEVEQRINISDTDDEEQRQTVIISVDDEPETRQSAQDNVTQNLIKRKDRDRDLEEPKQGLDKETENKKQRNKTKREREQFILFTNKNCFVLFIVILIFASLLLCLTLTAISVGMFDVNYYKAGVAFYRDGEKYFVFSEYEYRFSGQ